MRSIFLVALLMCNGAVYGGVTIFGLKIGESTITEVESLYSINQVAVDGANRVSIYELNRTQIKAEDSFGTECNFVSLRFNEDGVLVVLDTSFKAGAYRRIQDKFDKLFHRDEFTDAEVLFYSESATKYTHDGVEVIVFNIDEENQTRLSLAIRRN